MLFNTNEARVSVGGLIIVRVANVLKRAAVLRETCDLHLCSRFHLRSFLVLVEVFFLSLDLLTATSGKRFPMLLTAQVCPSKFLRR